MTTRYKIFCQIGRALAVVLFALSAFGAKAGVTITTLHSFQVFTNGGYPNGLVFGGDGNLYGTAFRGGGGVGRGTVFRITTNGVLTNLYAFTGQADGGDPAAGLALGADGSLYGTTCYASGTIFKINTNGVFTQLYSLLGGGNGDHPITALVQGRDGNFYGTTAYGGTYYGTIFKVTTNRVFTVLHSLQGGSDGSYPWELVQGTDGNFYGTTAFQGVGGNGTVFKMSTNGVFTSLYQFTNSIDGANPFAGLVQGNDGWLYGTTENGGADGYGTAFKISTSGAFTRLCVFSGTNGATPHARLLQGSDGYFYGTTYEGGALGYGTVFKLTHAGDLTTLYSFGGSDGANPMSGLVQSSDGNIYGTTWNGGADGYGTVFKITPDGTLTTLYSFPGLNDGLRPYSALVQGDDGSFYGTAGGGKNNVGSSFKITTAGAFTRLYADFYRGRNGAAYPSGLVKGSDGNFYGGAGDGGYDGYGAIFQMTPNGAFTILFSFAGSNGSEPGTPVQGSDGELYGTTFQNGSGPGTVFKISTNGAHTVLHYFTGTDGKNPVALIQGSDGDYYGTTYAGGTSTNGTVFKITASGVLTSLYSFNGIDGSSPYRLVQGSDGNFYGTTYAGGTYFNGTVFKITANGAFTSLYSFTGGNDGANPYGSLLEASDGSFYGTTPFGGAYTNGTVFKIRANGVFTTLCSFTGSNDGANPYAGLARGNDGYLYGTTYGGGAGKVGTVFRMAIAPEFIAIAVTNGAISLTWSSETGKKYQLQYGSEVNSGSWANVGNPLTASGSTLSATDFVANDPQRLYRVVALPQ